MSKPDKQLKPDDLEIYFLYDLTRGIYSAEVMLKGTASEGEVILTVCLPDGKNKDAWGAPFIEGHSTRVYPELLVKIITKLQKWRDATGDHLCLFSQ